MPHPYKPDGYPSLAPYIMTDQAQRVIEFAKTAFNAVEVRRFESPNGGVMHAELRIDDSMIMLSDATPDFPGFPIWIHLYVVDVDATYTRAIAAGGRSVQEPAQKPNDPDRRGGVADPAGNTWWISTQV